MRRTIPVGSRDANANSNQKPLEIFTDDFSVVVVFSGVGLLISLIAIVHAAGVLSLVAPFDILRDAAIR
jgi:hypothetical protein